MKFITPDWPAPKHIRAYSTTRQGGHSQAPYDSFNLATSTEDNLQHVEQNRALLQQQLQLPRAPLWLKQIHSTKVNCFDPQDIEADACYSNSTNQVCAVMTADCLPVLLCSKDGTEVAAVHAGWRGLADGVIEATLKHFHNDAHDILAWFGPAIGADVFEVGDDVRDCFLKHDAQIGRCFKKHGDEKWLANIYALASKRLYQQGVTNIYGGEYCTYSNNETFFSFRRDGVTGRMAHLIWIAED